MYQRKKVGEKEGRKERKKEERRKGGREKGRERIQQDRMGIEGGKKSSHMSWKL
jgi:hypothetical protein